MKLLQRPKFVSTFADTEKGDEEKTWGNDNHYIESNFFVLVPVLVMKRIGA